MAFACKPAEQGDVVIADVNVIDVIEGKIMEGQDVIIEGDKIKRILPHGQVKLQSALLVEGKGKFLIPGLWDMHVHIRQYEEIFLPLFVTHGITGVRDMFNPTVNHIGKWKDSINALPFSPRIGEAIGTFLVGTNSSWLGTTLIERPEQSEAIIDSIVAGGSDAVKIYSPLPSDLALAIIDECNKRNLPFLGHIPTGMDALELSNLGMRSMEHLIGISFAYSSSSDSLVTAYRNFLEDFTPWHGIIKFVKDQIYAHDHADSSKIREVLTAFANNKTWQCPTLIVNGYIYNYLHGKGLPGETRYFPDSIQTKFKERMRSANQLDSLRAELWSCHKELLGLMKEYEVPVMAGTDASIMRPVVPGVSLHEELRLYQEVGFEPIEALRTATINPARYLERTHELGSVEEGKLADLVLLEANPLEDIRNTQTILDVIKDGKHYSREHLDKVLENILAEAQD